MAYTAFWRPTEVSRLTHWIDRLTFLDGLAHYGGAGHESEAYTLAAGAPISIDNLIAPQVNADTQETALRIGGVVQLLRE